MAQKKPIGFVGGSSDYVDVMISKELQFQEDLQYSGTFHAFDQQPQRRGPAAIN